MMFITDITDTAVMPHYSTDEREGEGRRDREDEHYMEAFFFFFLFFFSQGKINMVLEYRTHQ